MRTATAHRLNAGPYSRRPSGRGSGFPCASQIAFGRRRFRGVRRKSRLFRLFRSPAGHRHSQFEPSWLVWFEAGPSHSPTQAACQDHRIYDERRSGDGGAGDRSRCQGYITKNEDPALFADAVASVAKGGVYLRPEMATKIAFVRASAKVIKISDLSTRELGILRLIAAGRTLAEIAESLISPTGRQPTVAAGSNRNSAQAAQWTSCA